MPTKSTKSIVEALRLFKKVFLITRMAVKYVFYDFNRKPPEGRM